MSNQRERPKVLHRPLQQALAPVEYREAMSRFAGAVSIVTTDGEAGLRGVTASAVMSVSDNPPTLAICLNRNREENRFFERNRVLALNTLCFDQVALAQAFAGVGDLSMVERFATGEWTTLRTGAPVLREARMALDCVVVDVRSIHTHYMIMAEVIARSQFRDSPALVYVDRSYRSL